jgi:hypothetical protein
VEILHVLNESQLIFGSAEGSDENILLFSRQSSILKILMMSDNGDDDEKAIENRVVMIVPLIKHN